jgi:hypothetical protein
MIPENGTVENTKEESSAAESRHAGIWLEPDESPGYLVRDTNLAVGKALRRRLSDYGMTLGQYYFMRALWIDPHQRNRDRGLYPGRNRFVETVAAVDEA